MQDTPKSLVVDSDLGISVSEADVQALLDAQSSMGDPPLIGGVDYEAGATFNWNHEDPIQHSLESDTF